MAFFSKAVLILSVTAGVGCGIVNSSARVSDVPDMAPVIENAKPTPKGAQTAVFAGGCFWGVEAVFRHVKGVVSATSGYTGGDKKNPTYDEVSTGNTGHAESVQVVYDPSKVTYSQLLTIFFSVVQDPTELNYQGPDHGTQYRSAVFYTTDDQKQLAEQYIKNLTDQKAFAKPIVTQVVPLTKFWQAESYHQNYLALHPDEPYIVYNDIPKVNALKDKFGDLYQ